MRPRARWPRQPSSLRHRRHRRCPPPCRPRAAIPMPWVSRGWSKSTPRAAPASASSTSRAMISCTKAIFFPIGLHATYEPGILKQVAAAGHAIGPHTWCHQDLSKTKGRCNVNGKVQTVEYNPKDEIEMGISAVHWAVGGPTAPYFRFPALRQPQELIDYLGKRNIAIFSADMDSFDF